MLRPKQHHGRIHQTDIHNMRGNHWFFLASIPLDIRARGTLKVSATIRRIWLCVFAQESQGTPVKSDIVHLIVECRAFVLQPLGVEQFVHTKWPTEIFAHSCIRGQTYINSPLWTSPPAAIIDSCHVLRQPKAFCLRAAYHSVRVWRS